MFEDEAKFANQCSSVLLENFWLRSWSNRTYLWFSEITDQNPANFNDNLAYFQELKTTASTASGKPKDEFHYTIPTDEYNRIVSSGARAGYGARWKIVRSITPREIRVAYVESGSPATAATLARGTRVLEIDGVDAVNGSSDADINALEAGLYPEGSGESHTFIVQDVGSTETREVTMTSAIVQTSPVLMTKTIDTPSRKAGYMLFNSFGSSISEEALFDAMQGFSSQGVSDLILDIRYNGGGFLDIAAELGYMIGGSNTSGHLFERYQFNSKFPNSNPITGGTYQFPFHNTGQGYSVDRGAPLPTLNLNRVFILTTNSTCSASESLMNSLRGVNVEVIMIGSKTCGKPYGFYAKNNCGETYFTIQFKGVNDQGFGNYADGFTPQNATSNFGVSVPGCAVDDDFEAPLGDASEAMLSAALGYKATGSCPAVSSKPITKKLSYGADLTAIGRSERLLRRDFVNSARILDDPH